VHLSWLLLPLLLLSLRLLILLLVLMLRRRSPLVLSLVSAPLAMLTSATLLIMLLASTLALLELTAALALLMRVVLATSLALLTSASLRPTNSAISRKVSHPSALMASKGVLLLGWSCCLCSSLLLYCCEGSLALTLIC
jgi:hypothetical protein